MNEVIIIFASATTAARIKKQLTDAGFYARVMQTPKVLSSGGCSFAVKSTAECIGFVKNAAKKLDVKIKGFYEIVNNEYVGKSYDLS